MSDYVLHPVTNAQLEAFRNAPSHAVMLAGPTGSGKLSVAIQLAENLLELTPGSFGQHSYGLVISSIESKAIGIEKVRELEHFLSLKVPRVAAFNRAIIIENSQLLTLEAQNALLKTLEEPPASTLIVLTANREQALLPTIRSRAQLIAVRRPERPALETYFQAQNFDNVSIQRAYNISGGLPGLMHALLSHEEHPLLEAVARARELLSQPTYQRLQAVDELARNRPQAVELTFVLQQMAHVSLQTASGPAAAKWQAVLEASYATAKALQGSAQPKLALTNLMLQL